MALRLEKMICWWRKRLSQSLKSVRFMIMRRAKDNSIFKFFILLGFGPLLFLALRDLVVNLTSVIYYPIDESNPLAGIGWFMYFIMMTPLIIIPTMMLPRAISTANKNRLYVVAGLFIVSYGSIEQLIVPALILYGVSKIKEE